MKHCIRNRGGLQAQSARESTGGVQAVSARESICLSGIACVGALDDRRSVRDIHFCCSRKGLLTGEPQQEGKW